MSDKNKKSLRILLGVVLGLLVVLIGAVCAYMIWERAPEVAADAESKPLVIAVSKPATRGVAESGSEGNATRTRREGVYTFLLAGQDNGNGNTDTMMVARMDTRAHSIDVVSIPRDTMVNASWQIRKLNAAYAMGELNGESGAENLRRHIARLIGFEVDCYAIVNLDAFVQVIDAMGGVDFDVPRAMDYEDLGQDLTIHLQPGYQHLNGYQAMGLCRFRSGYANADLGRIEMQHQFLKACAEQFITLGNIPNVSKVVDILSSNLETDLTGGNIAWFLRQFLQCKSENIHFYTAPNQVDGVDGISYTILELDPWLEMINSCLDPYQEAIAAEDLDLVYTRNGVIGYTTQKRFSSAASSAGTVPAMQESAASPAETEETVEAVQEPAGPQIVVVDLNEPVNAVETNGTAETELRPDAAETEPADAESGATVPPAEENTNSGETEMEDAPDGAENTVAIPEGEAESGPEIVSIVIGE